MQWTLNYIYITIKEKKAKYAHSWCEKGVKRERKLEQGTETVAMMTKSGMWVGYDMS